MVEVCPECGLRFSSRAMLETHKRQMQILSKSKDPMYARISDAHETARLNRLRAR